MSESEKFEKSPLFHIEAAFRSHASLAQILELDAVLMSRDFDEPVRTAQAHELIEKFVEGMNHVGKI